MRYFQPFSILCLGVWVAIVVASTAPAVAQPQKGSTTSPQPKPTTTTPPATSSQWPELSAFSAVFSEVTRAVQGGNLTALKARSGEIAVRAARLAASRIPQKYNAQQLRPLLQKLSKSTRLMNKVVKSKLVSDSQLKSSFQVVQNVVGEVMRIAK
jgi:hypothetical protein